MTKLAVRFPYQKPSWFHCSGIGWGWKLQKTAQGKRVMANPCVVSVQYDMQCDLWHVTSCNIVVWCNETGFILNWMHQRSHLSLALHRHTDMLFSHFLGFEAISLSMCFWRLTVLLICNVCYSWKTIKYCCCLFLVEFGGKEIHISYCFFSCAVVCELGESSCLWLNVIL